MKSPTLPILALLCACMLSQTFAQKKKSDPPGQQQFEKAADLFENGDFLTAAVEFEQVIKLYPKSELVGRAHYNKAICYYRFKDYETAEKTFLEILEEPYNEEDPNDIMEPYALYKHHACRYLADMALEQKNFVATEKYIAMFDKKYPYRHFCGNEWSAYNMFKAVMYSKVYVGTGRLQKALEELLPHMFANGLSSNEEVLNELVGIFEKNYTKDDLNVEFEKALSTLASKKIKKRTAWFIKLYGVEIEVDGWFGYDEEQKVSEEEHHKQIVLNNELFKRFL